MTQQTFACRSCGNTELTTILSLGRTPLANALLTREQLAQPEPIFPLTQAYCPDCTLVQITETVPPEELFREYLYFSSFSDAMLEHSHALCERLMHEEQLNANSCVIEIASNDGYLLQNYKRNGIPVLGIEPAMNIARVAQEERGIPTIAEFFGAELARDLLAQGRTADIIHANNVLAHVPDLNGFVEGIELLLKDDGIAIIEAPYVKDLIDRIEFDTIYHEHLCYFSLTALKQLVERHRLHIINVERIPIHGGSLRLFLAKRPDGDGPRFDIGKVQQLLAEEEAWGVARLEFYLDFAQRVNQLRDELRNLLAALKQQGKRIAVYGASAKGSTLLNYFGIGRDQIEFVADRSTVKQGLYTPGTHLLIQPPSALVETMPDYVLLLTWNFAEEILEQQALYRARGGRFIIPIPSVQIV